MFTKRELDVITRALTGYEEDLKEVIKAIEDCEYEGDVEVLEEFGRRLKEAEKVNSKAMEIKWQMIHKKGVK